MKRPFTIQSFPLPKALLTLPLLGIAVVTQIKYDEIMHPKIIFTTETRYILPGHIVNNFSFGFKNILADLYWVRAIQDFSIWDGKDSFYVQEYKNIAALDPKFSYPYLLGILTFTAKSAGGKDLNTKVLETLEPVTKIGIENLPNNWEIPFYLGTGFQLNKRPDKALEYLKLAAANPNAPERVKDVYRSYLKRTLTGDNAAREFIKTIYDTTDSETTKKMLKNGVMINDLTEVIKTITLAYKKRYGFYPSSLDDLVRSKMIQVGPELNDAFRITINPNNGEVKVSLRVSK